MCTSRNEALKIDTKTKLYKPISKQELWVPTVDIT